MTSYEKMSASSPYSFSGDEKRLIFDARMNELTRLHYRRSGAYRRMLDSLSYPVERDTGREEIPFLPVRLFKELDLMSIDKPEVFKIMTSSGTTGQAVSKIYLDQATAASQQKVLVKIVSEFTRSSRMPMIILDSPSVLKDRMKFSARGAGILGFSIFGREKIYALDDGMNINLQLVSDFLERHSGENILLYGFTFIIWQHFYKELSALQKKLDLSNGVLIHGGGWKKLADEAVSSREFKEKLFSVCGIPRVYEYYGMVEQTGSIYMECEKGRLHASIYSDVIVRDPLNFKPCKIGVPGVIEVLSALPESYPGHVLLTEDEGVLLGEDNCECGRMGKYFKVTGRIKNAEIRGCSDTYAAEF